MEQREVSNPLPHEWICGVFMISLWLRLVWSGSLFSRDALLLLLLIVSNVGLLIFASLRKSNLTWRLRLVFYPVAMNLVYFLLATAVPSVHPEPEDKLLQSIDLWIFGSHPAIWLEPYVQPVATEFLSICYLWYLFYLFSSQIEYLVGDIDTSKLHYAGLFSIYGIGYACYSLVPAVGPYIAIADQFTVSLEGGWFTHLTSETVLAASNRVDVFPSLHVAITIYLLMFDRRHKRWRFLLYLFPCIGLIIATIYLRYHYATDVICGAGLSMLALWIARDQSTKVRSMPVEDMANGNQAETCAHHGSVERYRAGTGETLCT